MTFHPAFSGRRRRLLELMAGGGAALALSLPAMGREGEGPLMRTIPGSGERVPAIGMGTYRTFDIDLADRDSRARMANVLGIFIAGGGRVVDSSPMYGRAEAVLGTLAGELGVLDRLFVATKVWTRGREAGIEQMQRSEELLRTRPLDLMQVHNLVDVETHLRTLSAWKAEGRIRFLGVTHYTASRHDDLARLVERYPLDAVQVNYNLLERNAENRLLPACADRGVAVLVNEPFEQGALFRRVGERPLPDWAREIDCRTWAQCFLKFIVAHPAVTCALPATSDPEHAEENIGALYGALPDAALRRRMVAAVTG